MTIRKEWVLLCVEAGLCESCLCWIPDPCSFPVIPMSRQQRLLEFCMGRAAEAYPARLSFPTIATCL